MAGPIQLMRLTGIHAPLRPRTSWASRFARSRNARSASVNWMTPRMPIATFAPRESSFFFAMSPIIRPMMVSWYPANGWCGQRCGPPLSFGPVAV